ncbi:hypothetical protein Bca101_018199 [Brassica carinata]
MNIPALRKLDSMLMVSPILESRFTSFDMIGFDFEYCRRYWMVLRSTLAINDSTLSDMDIPDSYLTTLPKVYLYTLLSESISLCVETVVINKVSAYRYHRSTRRLSSLTKSRHHWLHGGVTGGLSNSKSSWDMMKYIGDAERGNDKSHILAARAGGPGAYSFV